MPKMPPKPCTQPMCKQFAIKGGRCEDHKHKPWASSARKSKDERGYGYQWKKLRKLILERDTFLCVPCSNAGRLTKATEVDHILNKESGGDDNPANLQSICYPCHIKKTNRESQEARKNG